MNGRARALLMSAAAIGVLATGCTKKEEPAAPAAPASSPAAMVPARLVAVLVTALGLRFAMRAVGVRGDVPFPGVVYSVTAPLVAPFYGLFPLGDARFDHPVIEVASLVAAGVVVAIALVVYAVWLVVREG